MVVHKRSARIARLHWTNGRSVLELGLEGEDDLVIIDNEVDMR